jgi:transmembrane sensor
MNNQAISESLLAKYLARETDAAETALVENWLSQNPENQKELAHYQQIWENSKKIDSKNFDTDLAWQKVKSRIDESKNKGKIIEFKPARQPFFNSYRIAAGITILLSAIALIYILNNNKSELINLETQNNTLEKVLPDGSKVFLNKNSKITYSTDFEGDTREVSLNGEAFFDIKRDESKPFVIDANETEIKVLGTSFNVNAYTKNVKVSVETGKVQFSKKKKQTILTKGEEAEFVAENDTLLRRNTLDKNTFAYKTHVYVFEDSSLEHIIKVLSTGYQVPIAIQNPQLQTCRLTVRFDNETLQNSLNIIAETLNLQISKNGERYFVNGAGCK